MGFQERSQAFAQHHLYTITNFLSGRRRWPEQQLSTPSASHQVHILMFSPDKYQCQAPCNLLLGHKMFDDAAMRKSKANKTQRLVCLQCIPLERAKEKRLSTLMKASKRKGCSCFTAIGHDVKCPMHPRKAGEHPYPNQITKYKNAEAMQMCNM